MTTSSLARKTKKYLNQTDLNVTVQEIENWLIGIDEDETVSRTPLELAQWFIGDNY
jgi:hypothetical protein